ncbi:MAG: methyltransferase domain-containing protein [Luteolibacter sp.]
MRDWDACYRNQDTPWDRGGPAPPLLELLENSRKTHFAEGPVLVPGCGSGHDVRALADARIQAHGLDISPCAVEIATSLTKHPLASFSSGDFLDPAWQSTRQFQAMWEHTCFCAIHPSQRNQYAAAAASILPKDTHLCGVFYIEPWEPGKEEGRPPYKTSVEEVILTLAPYFELLDGWVPQRSYPGRENREWLAIFRRNGERSIAMNASLD